ncbi:hypothetical protein BN1708_019770, partial [Verticillium longisporum]
HRILQHVQLEDTGRHARQEALPAPQEEPQAPVEAQAHGQGRGRAAAQAGRPGSHGRPVRAVPAGCRGGRGVPCHHGAVQVSAAAADGS